MTYGSFLCPPQIHLEQEDPFNLDNDMIEGSLLNKSSPKYLIPSDSVLELVFGSGLLMFCYGVLLCCSAVSGGKFMFETLQYFWPCKKTNVEINMNRNSGNSNTTGNNRQLMAAEWRDLLNDPELWEQAPPPYYNHL